MNPKPRWGSRALPRTKKTAPKYSTKVAISALFTPAAVAEAVAKNLRLPATAGVSLVRLRELRTIKRLQAEVEELSQRDSYGLTLRSGELRWAALLGGSIACLRILLGPEEAAVFFVTHVVAPALRSQGHGESRDFVQEMSVLGFTEQGIHLGEMVNVEALINATPHASEPRTP